MMVSSLRRSRPLLLVILLAGLVTVTYLSLGSNLQGYARRYTGNANEASSSDSEGNSTDAAWTIPYRTDTQANRNIANTTLGFEKIFVLGLADRLLKRDSVELGASVTDLNITWIDGVYGDKIHKNAIPPAHDKPGGRWFRKDSELGCWRGHMDIMHKIVTERIGSALVMEDDADWDIHIVQQMQQFADTTREFLKEDPMSAWHRKRRAKTGSPYGEGWDILWIGHCGGFTTIKVEDFHIAVIKNDSTVPPAMDIRGQLFGFAGKKDYICSAQKGIWMPKGIVCNSPWLEDNQRLVQERTSPLCTTGYAISLQGATKMLARLGGLSLLDIDSPVDQAMKDMCKQTGKPGAEREAARCLTVSPAYIRTHRAKGPMKADSDIEPERKGTGNHLVGLSEGLVYPTRLNVENIISGYEPESQYIQEANGTWRYKTREEYRSLP